MTEDRALNDGRVIDVGPWRGPTLEEWLARISKPVLNNIDGEREVLPLIKPPPRPRRE